jgi:tetratricopeptide (TPR) repeat protein
VQDAARVEQAASGLKDAAEKLKKRDVDGAITLLKEVLGRDPRNQGALFLLGMSYAEKKMCREAVDTLTPATGLNPALPGAYFALGVCHKQLGDPAKALESYDKSVEQDPKHADSAYNAGLILFESSRIDEAQARFERLLALKPADPDVLEMLGRCDLNQGKFAAAIEHLEKARAATSDPAKIAFLDELIRKVRAQVK